MKKFIFSLIVCLLFISCNIFVSEDDSTVYVSANVGSRLITTSDITSYDLQVTGRGMKKQRVKTSDSVISLSVPQGSSRTFSLIVTLKSGITISGKETVDIRGNTVTITIHLDNINSDGINPENIITEYDVVGLATSLENSLGSNLSFSEGDNIFLETTPPEGFIEIQWLTGEENKTVIKEGSKTINIKDFNLGVGTHTVTFRAVYSDKVIEEEVILVLGNVTEPIIVDPEGLLGDSFIIVNDNPMPAPMASPVPVADLAVSGNQLFVLYNDGSNCFIDVIDQFDHIRKFRHEFNDTGYDLQLNKMIVQPDFSGVKYLYLGGDNLDTPSTPSCVVSFFINDPNPTNFNFSLPQPSGLRMGLTTPDLPIRNGYGAGYFLDFSITQNPLGDEISIITSENLSIVTTQTGGDFAGFLNLGMLSENKPLVSYYDGVKNFYYLFSQLSGQLDVYSLNSSTLNGEGSIIMSDFYAASMAVDSNYIYMIGGDSYGYSPDGFKIYNRDPIGSTPINNLNPISLSTIPGIIKAEERHKGITLFGTNYALIADHTGGVLLFDISDKTNPKLVDSLKIETSPEIFAKIHDVVVGLNYIYLAAENGNVYGVKNLIP